MFKKIDDITTPNGNKIIWRYMGLEKFYHLITTKKLFFSRLSEMTDRYEGSIPEELMKSRYQELNQAGINDPYTNMLKERKQIEEFNKYTFVNCWTINTSESYALWKIYLQGSNSGVAIKSTIGKLRKSIEAFKDNPDYYIGQVEYDKKLIDFPPSLFQLTTFKKRYYKYEEELRLFFTYDPDLEKKNPIYKELFGWLVDVDIYELIDKIYISPFVGSWFRETFRIILKNVDPKLLNKIQVSGIRDN